MNTRIRSALLTAAVGLAVIAAGTAGTTGATAATAQSPTTVAARADAAMAAPQIHTGMIKLAEPDAMHALTLAWTPYGKCSFLVTNWVSVRYQIDTVSGKKKVYNAQWSTAENIDTGEIYENRNGVDIKQGEFKGRVTKNGYSGVTGLPYMATITSSGYRLAIAKFHRVTGTTYPNCTDRRDIG